MSKGVLIYDRIKNFDLIFQTNVMRNELSTEDRKRTESVRF